MRNFQKEGRLKYAAQSKPFLVFLGILMLFSFFKVFDFAGKMKETKRSRETVENKIAELEKSKAELHSEVLKLKTEKGVEEIIRKKFGLAKRGEEMIVIVEDKNKKEIKEETDSPGFFYFLKNWLKQIL